MKAKVVRIKPGCCGMKEGHVYDAEVEGSYVRVWQYVERYRDEDDFKELSTPHWIPGFFEVVEEIKRGEK